MTPPRGWRRLAAALALSTLAAGLTACGSESADAADDAGGGTIRIGYQAFPSGDLIVKDQGWLEDALPEYDIEWTKFDSGASINTAFVAGAIDLAAIGSSPVARGLSTPLDIPYQVTWILDVAPAPGRDDVLRLEVQEGHRRAVHAGPVQGGEQAVVRGRGERRGHLLAGQVGQLGDP